MTLAALAALAATALAAAAGGCGFGPGASEDGEATLRVTRDYGSELVADASVSDPSSSETVIRMLDREVDLETRYGGGFVQAIDGVSGGADGGRNQDWFFYVNGIESPIGAAEVEVSAGDRIWWDHRDWTDVMRVPAVVGSWPEPLAQATADSPRPVALDCQAARQTCDEAAGELGDDGIDVGKAAGSAEPQPRVLVGPWDAIRDDDSAGLLESGPSGSGVFAEFERGDAGWTLEALDEAAAPATTLGQGAGLVAVVREGEDPPTFLVTGTNEDGVERAVALLDDEALRDRYAVATDGGEPRALPVIGEGA